MEREQIDGGNDDIRSKGNEWTLETTSTGTTGDGNAQGNGSNSMSALLEANKMHLEKLKKEEEKAKPIIQAIQLKIDESGKRMANRNAEYQKQIAELEIEKRWAVKSEKEKYQKEIAELKAKNLEENANFAKEMTSLKEQLKEKISWNQVDLVMNEKIRNPIGNCLNSAKSTKSISICANGLKATNNASVQRSVSAEKGFHISVDFPVPVLYYFEVTIMSLQSDKRQIVFGLSSENIPDDLSVGFLPNSYGMGEGCDDCRLSGKQHDFEWPNGEIEPTWNAPAHMGCGLLLHPERELSIFFTLNGILLGQQIPINPTANTLYPTVSIKGKFSVEANFGDNLAKPFCYDIKRCPGMDFE